FSLIAVFLTAPAAFSQAPMNCEGTEPNWTLSISPAEDGRSTTMNFAASDRAFEIYTHGPRVAEGSGADYARIYKGYVSTTPERHKLVSASVISANGCGVGINPYSHHIVLEIHDTVYYGCCR